MIVLIDNYDSFTYNLYQMLGHFMLGHFHNEIKVFRNDQVTVEEIEKLHPTHLIISPGPKYPKDAGISIEAIRFFNGKIPILGVCLGHQAIAEAFGSKVVPACQILHGKTSEITVDETCPLFKGLGKKLIVGRYHSLIVEKKSLVEDLKVIASDEKGAIMALRHQKTPTFGLQFHPESILTPQGSTLIKNFLEVEK